MSIHEAVRTALAMARQGVDYGRGKARCPMCGQKMKTVETRTEGHVRTRRHRCTNVENCLLGSMALLVKSVEALNKAA